MGREALFLLQFLGRVLTLGATSFSELKCLFMGLPLLQRPQNRPFSHRLLLNGELSAG